MKLRAYSFVCISLYWGGHWFLLALVDLRLEDFLATDIQGQRETSKYNTALLKTIVSNSAQTEIRLDPPPEMERDGMRCKQIYSAKT